jgi:hypothetical protein
VAEADCCVTADETSVKALLDSAALEKAPVWPFVQKPPACGKPPGQKAL